MHSTSMYQFLEAFVGFLKGVLILLVGPLNAQMGYLALVVLLDTVLGIMLARKQKSFYANYLFGKTLEKTIVYFTWIIIGHAGDVMIGLPNTIRGLVVLALFGQEVISALGNTGSLGYKGLVGQIKSIFEPILKKSGEK